MLLRSHHPLRLGQAFQQFLAAFQAPCRPTGSNLSPFCTLQTMAAKCLRRRGSRVGWIGTSCRIALSRSACKSEAGLSSAWLLAATSSTTTARLFCKVTRPSTGMRILCSMVGDGMMTMLRAESYKRWTEGDRRDALQRSGQRRGPLTKFEHVFEVGGSSIQDWRLKILQDSCWEIFNPGLKIEDWRFPGTLLGESSIQDWGFNIKGSLLDWRFPNKSPGESSIFNPGLQILQEEPWRIFSLQSWIEDSQVWTQVWTSSLNIRSELHGSSNVMVCACQFQVFSLRCICI